MNKIEYKKNRPSILFVGNGINRLYDKEPENFKAETIDELDLKNQEDIEFLNENNCKDCVKCSKCNTSKLCEKCEIISKLSFPMGVSAKYGGNEEKVGKLISNYLKDEENMKMSKEKRMFIEKLLDLDIKTILSTNYSFEFEKTVQASSYGKIQSMYCQSEITENEKNSKDINIYQYIKLKDDKYLWHIHGIGTRSSSIVLGQTKYGELFSKVVKRAEEVNLEYKNNKKTSNVYSVKSWVDYFLISDVHILGFTFDVAEIDLLWLLAYKYKHFKFSKVYFYILEDECRGEEFNKRKILLETYGVHFKKIYKSSEDDKYLNYYEKSIEEIKNQLKNV